MIRPIAAMAALMTLVACSIERTPAAPTLDLSSSKATTGGSTTASITVTAATPALAPTDTLIDVQISGTGFAKGATARWSIAGDTTQVQVLSTAYVNSTSLRARVAVPAGAKVGTYDIIVTNVGGKKGVGAELFTVVLGDPKTDWYFPTGTAAPLVGLRSDGLYLQNGRSVYGDGVCGVSSKIFATTQLSGSGDATLQTDNPNLRDRKCAAYPRTMIVQYADGRIDRGTVFANVRELQSPTFSIPIGASVERGLTLNLSGTALRCGRLRWNDFVQTGTEPVPTPVQGKKVIVTRVDAATWLVKSQSAPNNVAYCVDNGALYTLDVEFTIVSRTLPWL